MPSLITCLVAFGRNIKLQNQIKFVKGQIQCSDEGCLRPKLNAKHKRTKKNRPFRYRRDANNLCQWWFRRSLRRRHQ